MTASISVPEKPSEADYQPAKDLSNKDLRKIGFSWDNINIESDEELLAHTRTRDIFTLPNPGTLLVLRKLGLSSPAFLVFWEICSKSVYHFRLCLSQQTTKKWRYHYACHVGRFGQVEPVPLSQA